MQIAYPWQIDKSGRTAGADPDPHIRQLIEQVLFTFPGERVNNPTFGSGVQQLVFAPASDALASAVQVTLPGALQLWLGDLIQVESVQVTSQDSTLAVTVQYLVRRTQQRQIVQLQRPV